MISLGTARQLKEAGLTWSPALNDFFAIPDSGLDAHVFVISDIMSTVGVRHKLPAVTFQGTVEWALDYVLISEAVWLPREDQLRELIISHLTDDHLSDGHLSDEAQPALRLETTRMGYRCEIRIHSKWHTFEAKKASEAYSASLLFILGDQGSESGIQLN